MTRTMMRPTRIGALTGTLLGTFLTAGPLRAQVVEYYHMDAIGNVRAITDASGNVIERHDYQPYGEEWLPQGGDAASALHGQGARRGDRARLLRRQILRIEDRAVHDGRPRLHLAREPRRSATVESLRLRQEQSAEVRGPGWASTCAGGHPIGADSGERDRQRWSVRPAAGDSAERCCESAEHVDTRAAYSAAGCNGKCSENGDQRSEDHLDKPLGGLVVDRRGLVPGQGYRRKGCRGIWPRTGHPSSRGVRP